MNALDLIPEEIEKDRLEKVAEFTEDEKDWAEPYKPGSFGCHELLDRTAMFAAMVEEEIQTHPACVANPDWFLLAEQAAAALRELYQQIGAEHLTTDEPSA